MSDKNNAQLLALKIKMLINGCNVASNFSAPANIYLKQVHLYKHSVEHSLSVPDDVVAHMGEQEIVVRLRCNSESQILLAQDGDKYYIQDQETQTNYPVSFIETISVLKDQIDNFKIGELCSLLGKDLVGVIPSNYCFYFAKGDECKFCEIWQTYKNDLRDQKAVKSNQQIKSAVELILGNHSGIKHLAVTTGNIKSYDYSAQLYCQLGQVLQSANQYSRLQDKLATLMPPEDLSIIDGIYAAGFNKIYFPLEVYAYEQFKLTCPGKDKFGYQKIIDALKYAQIVFGVGNVYTNLIYGLQSGRGLKFENAACYQAIDELLDMLIVPVFTIYHYGGHNQVGHVDLEHTLAQEFFSELGAKLARSNILGARAESVIFSQSSLSNTAYNEAFLLAKKTLVKNTSEELV
jgi:hypothetical protein